jgi:hypothetical protein
VVAGATAGDGSSTDADDGSDGAVATAPAGTDGDGAPGVDEPGVESGGRWWTSERAALAVFLVFVAGAFVWLVHYGTFYWFAGEDDWGLLQRHVGSVADLFRPQHAHWLTVPIIVVNGLYGIFGIRTYLPYELVVIALRLTEAGLVRVVMRRVGVGPWVATIAAAPLVLFGLGGQNYFLAIEVSFGGSLVFGLLQLIAADHDGRIDRRDWLGLLAGLVALMSSSVGPIMVIAVAVATLIRRGWRAAAFHAAPLGVLYAAWYLHYSRTPSLGFASSRPALGDVGRFVWSGEIGIFAGLGHYTIISIGLVVLLVVGLAVAWLPLSWPAFRRVAGPVIGLLVSAVVLFGAVSVERLLLGPDITRSSRYVDIGVACTLPALAVAADAIVRRWRYLIPVVLALFLVEIPVNATEFGGSTFPPSLYSSIQTLVIGAGYSPLTDQAAGDVQPAPGGYVAPGVDMDFIRRAKAEGKFPAPIDLTPEQQAIVYNRLALRQGSASLLDGLHCTAQTGPLQLELHQGEGLRLDHAVWMAPELDGKTGSSTEYHPADGAAVVLNVAAATYLVSPTVPGSAYAVCLR